MSVRFVKICFSYTAYFFQTSDGPINRGPADGYIPASDELEKFFDIEMRVHGEKLLEYQFPLMGDKIPLLPECFFKLGVYGIYRRGGFHTTPIFEIENLSQLIIHDFSDNVK